MGSYSKHIIAVEALLAVQGKKEFEQGIRSISSIEAKTRTYNKILQEHNLNQAEADKVLNQAGLRVAKNGDVVDRAGKKRREFNTSIKENVGALARFQMEQLGVMFGGMALNRAMTNLNATSREWLGIGELTSTMMGVTMLSANIDLLEFGVIPLFEALTSLPEGAQKAIGFLSFALEGLGGAMMVGGQLMLGLDSTSTMLSKIAGVRPDLVFTEKGLSAIKNKLSGSLTTLKNLGRIAGAGIALKFAYDDLEEGKAVAAMGDALVAAGLLKGGKVGKQLAIAGIALKFVGDEDFQKSFFKAGIKIIDAAISIGEGMATALIRAFNSVITGKKFDLEDLNMVKNFREAITESTAEGLESSFLDPTKDVGTKSAIRGFLNSFRGSSVLDRVVGLASPSSQGGSLNITNNIQVANLNEFGSLINQSNSQAIEDFKTRI